MAFLTNTSSTGVNPYDSTERYVLLAHPNVTDTLLLNQFGPDGGGYQPSKTIGLMSVADRTLSSIVVNQATYKKTVWSDLAFVLSKAQADVFDLMLLQQTPSQPITLSDRIADPSAPVNKNVIIESPNGRAIFGNLSQYLVQFSATEV